MKSEEKANELIEKFQKMHFVAGGIGINKKQSIECAKITVDEIISELETNKSNVDDDLLFDWNNTIIKYWIDVKSFLH